MSDDDEDICHIELPQIKHTIDVALVEELKGDVMIVYRVQDDGEPNQNHALAITLPNPPFLQITQAGLWYDSKSAIEKRLALLIDDCELNRVRNEVPQNTCIPLVDLEIIFVRQCPNPTPTTFFDMSSRETNTTSYISPYLLHIPSRALIWPLMKEISELLDPVTKIGLSIINEKPHIVLLTLINRLAESEPIVLDDDTLFQYINDTKSYFRKDNIKFNIHDCYCKQVGTDIIIWSSKNSQEHILGKLPINTFKVKFSIVNNNGQLKEY